MLRLNREFSRRNERSERYRITWMDIYWVSGIIVRSFRTFSYSPRFKRKSILLQTLLVQWIYSLIPVLQS